MHGSARRHVGVQISSVWLTQVLAMLLQLGYTATVSRLIAPAGFGSYGVALAVSAPLSMLSGLGLASSAARRTDESVEGDRRLSSVALISGAITSSLLFVGAGQIARVWDNPESSGVLRVLAFAVLFGPWGGVLSGVLRRMNRIRGYNFVTFASLVLGMLSGGVLVAHYRQPWALAIMPAASSLVIVLLGCLLLRRRAIPATRLTHVAPDLRFGVLSMANSLVSLTSYSTAMWSMSRFLGPVVLGSWNRAVVVGQLPLESANRSILTVIYPSFRSASPGKLNGTSQWSAMLAAAVTFVWPVSGAFVPALPAAVQILLGPDWTTTESMTQWLWMGAALMVPATLLSGALESSNHFRAIWAGQALLGATYLLGAVAMYRSESWLPMAVSVCVAAALVHVTQLGWAGRLRLIKPAEVLPVYAASAACAGGTFLISSLLMATASSAFAQVLVGVSTAAVVGLCCLAVARRFLAALG